MPCSLPSLLWGVKKTACDDTVKKLLFSAKLHQTAFAGIELIGCFWTTAELSLSACCITRGATSIGWGQ